ncbi:Nif3-like dinuclear metal center hexameric protein [Draconibacterium halophilum]|uniref:GTP cyclohydrolase 1 type 2 homolog n=1 Tax=Draconibacterium halophilum TaxID=2706887 RepID=A0A6C0RJ06_9BACT|nr:Nif3-like dinuclear metal center hexameric protein [Draconibacterium halophilum]QIA09595.1 Nif3-like dinuclear metal center hexameric protein [Draconibacterium halophilum]
MKIKAITNFLEDFAPLKLQESYDNAGLILGDKNTEVSAALVTLDVTEEVVDEAIKRKAGLIIAHHPIIFSGLKKITGKNYIERTLIKAIKNDVAIYAAHTNLDSVTGGVNGKICEKLGLENCKILQPSGGLLKKLITYVPVDHANSVREAVFAAGAGNIGNYDSCSFNTHGQGTFRGSDTTNPFIGKKGEQHYENEIRFETVFPDYLQGKIINALVHAHPYEEVAYDIYSLDNKFDQIGMGMTGTLPKEIDEKKFLKLLKETFGTGVIKHTALKNKKVRKIAVCGGAGSFLLNQAIAAGADVFVTGDFKYHQFFDAENKIVIADIGHFESEQFTKELFYEILTKKFPKFAVHLSEVNSNPVFYF